MSGRTRDGRILDDGGPGGRGPGDGGPDDGGPGGRGPGGRGPGDSGPGGGPDDLGPGDRGPGDGELTGRILVVNGPNLNLLGTREPERYGVDTLADVERIATEAAAELGFDARAVQSNHEGDLIDAIHAARDDCDAVVVNAGALTHTSVALRDALLGVALPFAEVHITNVHAREEFRHHSLLSDVALCVIVGAGAQGYDFAVRGLIRHLGSLHSGNA